MIKIGITGGIGSGKSVVGKLLKEAGATIIDSDKVTSEILEKQNIKNEISAILGCEVLERNILNKAKIASIIFNDKTKYEKYCNLVTNKVIAEIEGKIKELEASVHNEDFFIFVEAPLLFQYNMEDFFDYIIYVEAPIELRVIRAMKRDGVSREKIMERIKAQCFDKVKQCPNVLTVSNEGTILKLYIELITALQKINLRN